MSTTSTPANAFADLFLDPDHRDVEPRQGQIGHKLMRVKQVDEAARQIHFLCSTGDVDRYGESVDPSALEAAIEGFMSNPVFVAGHVYSSPSGEPTVIGHWVKLWVSKDGLEGIAQFDDQDPLALRYWGHYVRRNMRAVSIGFLTRKWEMREVLASDGVTRNTRVFTAVDLLEISAVTIPANPAALMRAASLQAMAPGVEPDDSKILQSTIEQAFKQVLTSGSGSFLRTLAMEIAEVMRSCQASGGDGYFGDFPEDDDEPESFSVSQGEPDNNLKALLREAMPA